MRVMMHGSWRISTALLLCINTCTSSIASSLISNSRDVVFDPLVSSPLQQDLNDSISFPIDRQFTFPRHFRLDEPFTITLKPKEALFVPLKPIHGHLFPSSSHATDVAIALELSACKGTALTYIATTGSTTYRRFSQARYQCLTISNATDAQHHNLCPIVHDDDDITLRQSPTTIDGFVLRAQIGHSVDIIAVLRSTAQKGAYTKAFFVPDVESSLDFNISYAIESSQVSFSLPQTWEPTQQAPVHEDCQGCEFAMYAEMVPPVNSSVVVDDHPPLPYCLARQGGVKYKLPSPTTSSGGIQQVTLPESFADEFSISGDYRFVLVASLPAKTNNGHTALLTYRPTRAKVTAPTHYTSHILIILGVVVVVASIGVAAAKSEQVKALWERASGGDHDDESVQLLAQAIADQAAEDDDLEEHKEEEPQPPSLLEAIRKTQAQHTTPQPSPRPTAVQRDGYEEII